MRPGFASSVLCRVRYCKNRPVNFSRGSNAWILEKLELVARSQTAELTMDAELVLGEDKLSVNVTALPLQTAEKKRIGSMLMIGFPSAI